MVRIRRLFFLVYLLALPFGAEGQFLNFGHPLDPLSKEEMALAATVLREAGKTTAQSRFSTIYLNEPPKTEVIEFKPGSTYRREAFAIVYERTDNRTFEGVVDLRGKAVKSWREIPGVQPAILFEDIFLTQTIVRSDTRWQEAMRKRGITELGKVQIEPWPAGHYGFKDEENVRLVRALSYYRGDTKMAYAHPIEGVVAVVDLNRKRVLRFIDAGVVPVPKAEFDIDEKSVGKLREAPKPFQIVQPAGGSFEVHGHEIRWQKWRFRYAMHPREGLVLYTIGYEEDGKVRPILYRASLSEMVVPYGDPGEGWYFRNAFDEGETGVGRLALKLEARNDIPDNATLLDAVFPNETGGSIAAQGVIGLYERDGGVLWKHVDYLTNENQSRRSRELVLSWFANVANYEYGFNWVFHQDGTLEVEALLTGVMSTKGVPPLTARHDNHDEAFGHLVADGVEAVHHQHFFNFRLDFDLDGNDNTVVEQNTERLAPGPKNPYKNAFVMRQTPLRNEAEAQRQLNLPSHRRWLVTNPSKINALGQPVSFLLFSGENAVPLASPDALVRQRARFMDAHLWVTRYDPAEVYAAGPYPNQSKVDDGLAKWVRANRGIENKDIVLWYTMGVTHIPRPEDWPVMPVHKAGFKLMPVGFFVKNPALDVPRN